MENLQNHQGNVTSSPLARSQRKMKGFLSQIAALNFTTKQKLHLQTYNRKGKALLSRLSARDVITSQMQTLANSQPKTTQSLFYLYVQPLMFPLSNADFANSPRKTSQKKTILSCQPFMLPFVKFRLCKLANRNCVLKNLACQPLMLSLVKCRVFQLTINSKSFWNGKLKKNNVNNQMQQWPTQKDE